MSSIIGLLLQSLFQKKSQNQQQTIQNNIQISDLSKEYISIIGDVGGTNTRLVLIKFTQSSESYETIKKYTYKSAEQKSFEDVLATFLADVQVHHWPQMAHIGIAGAVFQNKNKITNLKWPDLDGDAIGKKFSIKQFTLYNDFEIASYGVLKLKEDGLIQINKAKAHPHQSKSVIGAGTGLGMSFIGAISKKNKNTGEIQTDYKVFPGEGGHASFPQITQEQQEYFNFLQTKFPEKGEQIGLEYAFVGPAIPYMYEFCQKKYPGLQETGEINIEKEVEGLKFSSYKDFPRKEVFEYGRLKKDKLCQKVVEFFLQIYGQTIGDVCLRTLCYGGVYLIGGITVSLSDFMIEITDLLMKDYKEKRPYLANIFEKIPIYIVKEQDIGLEGAFIIAQQNSKDL